MELYSYLSVLFVVFQEPFAYPVGQRLPVIFQDNALQVIFVLNVTYFDKERNRLGFA